MSVHLFAITCTTCRARLKVREASAIGQILACPKCGSMVQVVPPPGWKPGMTVDDAASGESGVHHPPATASGASEPAAVSLSDSSTAIPQPPPLPPPVPADSESTLAQLVRSPWSWGALGVSAMLVVGAWFLTSSRPAPSTVPAEPEIPPSLADQTAPADVQAHDSGPTFVERLTPVWNDATRRARAALEAFAQADLSTPKAAAPPPTPEPPPVVVLVNLPIKPAIEVQSPDSLGEIDVEARLSDAAPAVKFPDVSIRGFVDFVSQASTLPISFDLDALHEGGVTPSQHLTAVEAQEGTWGDLLTAALGKANLTYRVDHDQVVIETFPHLQTDRIAIQGDDVSDLADGDAKHLAELVRTFVEPGHWGTTAEDNQLTVADNAFDMNLSAETYARVSWLLDKLRVARGLPPKSSSAEKTLDPRAKLAPEKLSKPITAGFRRWATLRQVADYLQQQADIDIYLNTAALAAVGRSPQSSATLAVHDRSLADALDTLLAPLGLTWRAIDERTLEITTEAAARRHPETQFHRIRTLLAAGYKPNSLVASIRAQIAPESWNTDSATALVYDEPSGCLIVRHGQPVQRVIAEVLEKLNTQPAAEQAQR